MLKEIIQAFSDKMGESGPIDPKQHQDDTILVLGLQTTLPHECLHPNGNFLNLMACALSGQLVTLKALTQCETNIRNVLYYIDYLHETTLYGYVDVSEIEELKDQIIAVTF